MRSPTIATFIEGEGGNKNITYWPPVVLYTGSFKPNHATDHLTRNGRFQKKPAGLHSRAGKTQNNYGRTQHNSSHFSA